jgi:O-antigen ligase
MKQLKSFHWTEKMGLVNLALMLLSIPFDSGVGLLFACLWIVSIVLKNTLLKRWSFFGWHQDKTYDYNKSYHILIPMMCLWGTYLLSLLWTENMVMGWGEVGQMVWILVLPLFFSCTDFREIRQKHLRTILWVNVLLMSVLFVVLLMRMIVQAAISAEYSFLWYMMNQDFYYIHHSYMALYILTGLAFLYVEMDTLRKENLPQIILWVLCVVCLVLFLLCINSRAGLLCLVVLLFLCWLHQTFVRKKYRFAIISLLALSFMVIVVHFSLPAHFRRLSSTVEQISNGDASDGRFLIMGNAWTVIKDNVVLGVGAGDRMDVLTPFYVTEEDPDATVYCPHNQILDTWMATGILGLLALLLTLFYPLAVAWRKRQLFMLLFLTVLILSLMFESMLERQMGVVFVAVMYVYCAMMLSLLRHDE